MTGLLVDLQIALRNLLQHRRRTVFLGGAIGTVTALLILLGGLSTGIRETMLRSATTLMTGHVNVGGFYKVTAGQAAPLVSDYPKVMEVVRRAVPEMSYQVERGRGFAKVVSDSSSIQVGLGGIDIHRESGLKDVLHVLSGRLDDLAEPATILLFAGHAKRLDVKVGDALTISAPTGRGMNNTLDVRVAVVADDLGMMSQFSAFVPATSLRALYQLNQSSTGAVHVHLRPGEIDKAPAVAVRLRAALAEAGYRMMDPEPQVYWLKFEKVTREDWTGQKLDVTTWEDELSFMSWIMMALGVLGALLIGILLAIVVIGIMNTMWIAIRERTREIGTLRAIGMQRGRVLWMFLLESLLLGLGGTSLGVLTGVLVAAALNAAALPMPPAVQLILMSNNLTLSVHGAAVLQAIVSITFVTGAAALYPALRAARLKPVAAMQHFG